MFPTFLISSSALHGYSHERRSHYKESPLLSGNSEQENLQKDGKVAEKCNCLFSWPDSPLLGLLFTIKLKMMLVTDVSKGLPPAPEGGIAPPPFVCTW